MFFFPLQHARLTMSFKWSDNSFVCLTFYVSFKVFNQTSNERHLIGHQFIAIVTNYAGNILVRSFRGIRLHIFSVSFILFCFMYLVAVFGLSCSMGLSLAGTDSLVVGQGLVNPQKCDFSSLNSIPGIARQILNYVTTERKSLYGKFLLTQPPEKGLETFKNHWKG